MSLWRSLAWLGVVAAACSDNLIDPPQQEVPLPSPLLLQIGEADTGYNAATNVDLTGNVGRFRLAGTVSLPGPGYTIEASGSRLGLNVVVNLSNVAVPGVSPGSDLSGRTLVVEWELPRGNYRIIVQDDIKQLIERVVEVQ